MSNKVNLRFSKLYSENLENFPDGSRAFGATFGALTGVQIGQE